MAISPVLENQAPEEVIIVYKKIKQALDLPNLPLFFTYIGVFPEYLSYLSDQLVSNLENPKFNILVKETEEKIYLLIKSSLNKSEEKVDWLNRYKNLPSFYNFQKDLEKIFTVNLKLAFIFEDVSALVSRTSYSKTSDLDQSQRGAIEKDLLPRYIFLCQQEFNQLLKKEEFLIMRVGVEKLILSTLPLMPEKINSPINVFFKLTEKYKDFPDLLYLISEHFPTLAVQKMLFSGFMKN